MGLQVARRGGRGGHGRRGGAGHGPAGRGNEATGEYWDVQRRTHDQKSRNLTMKPETLSLYKLVGLALYRCPLPDTYFALSSFHWYLDLAMDMLHANRRIYVLNICSSRELSAEGPDIRFIPILSFKNSTLIPRTQGQDYTHGQKMVVQR